MICPGLSRNNFTVQNAAHPQPSLIYKLDSIVKPLDLSGVFERPQPLEIELGSGDGSFLIQYAQCNPHLNLIGVERLLGRLQKTDRKARRVGISNIRVVQIESSYFLRHLLPAGAAQALHIYFPDPWPKKKHRRHRLINEEFPAIAHRALSAQGRVHLRTDDSDYFTQIQEVFAASPLFRQIETPNQLLEIQTDFETEFRAKGIPVLEVSYAKAKALSESRQG